MCVPITAGADRQEATAQVEEILAVLSQAYSSMGVTIVTITGSSTLDRPVVVAVVRQPRPMPDLPDHRKIPWQDPDKAREPLRAQWDLLNREHPDYRDHPRVP